MALKTIDAERVSIDATSGGVSLTQTKARAVGVIRARCKVETAQIRIQADIDTTLTAGGTEGSPIKNVGDEFLVIGDPDLKNFRAIRTGSTSGHIQVQYEGEGNA